MHTEGDAGADMGGGSGGGRWKGTVLVTQLDKWSWKEVLCPRGGIPLKGMQPIDDPRWSRDNPEGLQPMGNPRQGRDTPGGLTGPGGSTLERR